MKPLLLVDIDGVISLFGFPPDAPPAGTFCTVDGIIHLISARAGPLLARLADVYELVWCSGWEEKADEHLPALLGVPRGIPHLDFDHTPRGTYAHWKLAAIDALAGPDRPLAWIDDALDAACFEWSRRRPGPTLLVATDPAEGLSEGHVATLLEWPGRTTGAGTARGLAEVTQERTRGARHPRGTDPPRPASRPASAGPGGAHPPSPHPR